MKWQKLKWLAAAWILACGSALGEEQLVPPETAYRAVAACTATRQWLESQRQGRQASAKAVSLSGPVQEQVYERYRKSFGYPIPQRFDREELGAGTASR